MNKQRFLAGDLFGLNGKRYYYHKQSNTVFEFTGAGGYLAYAQMETLGEEYAKLTGKFFTMPVSFGLEFKDLTFLRP